MPGTQRPGNAHRRRDVDAGRPTQEQAFFVEQAINDVDTFLIRNHFSIIDWRTLEIRGDSSAADAFCDRTLADDFDFPVLDVVPGRSTGRICQNRYDFRIFRF